MKPVPRIPAVITNSIIYLFGDCHDADGGVESGGSGFLLHMDTSLGHSSHLYAITAGHVVRGGNSVVRMNLRHESSGYQRTECLPFTVDDWVLHPSHDLAVCPLPWDFEPKRFDLSVISPNLLLTEQQFREQDIGPGDEVVYVGRFVGHAGKFENMPSVRFGNISMNPNEREPFEDAPRGIKQVAFLVEARSRSGYSGSPVFFLNQHAVNNRRAVFPPFDLRLLGIDFCHLTEKIEIGTLNGHTLNWKADVHAGMMGVIPSWYLLDFLATSPELIEQRIRDEEKYESLPASPVELDGRVAETLQIPLQPGSTIKITDSQGTTSLKIPEKRRNITKP